MDLFKYFLDNDNKPDHKPKSQSTKEIKRVDSANIDSKVITDKHVKLISKWINWSDVDAGRFTLLFYRIDVKYEFKLLFRGSRDGFTCEKLRELCDNQTRTVTIIKVKGGDEILGGYNPVAWNPGYRDLYYMYTKESFIFSFNDKSNVENCILSRVKDNGFAIRDGVTVSPSFGKTDLFINKDILTKGKCKKDTYEKAIRKAKDNFVIEEYEVFQVIQR
ncbi:14077_t:CDS:1 [Funneliformis caledonium]|uniref:14077_t:CDS:1 n=1 Tax=Funneliformis caledonium TaxID=1117310 RepID=A0A9N9HM43_9GLOM|nr:14077_t:CDS:1 [Funneliformis caledonium]